MTSKNITIIQFLLLSNFIVYYEAKITKVYAIIAFDCGSNISNNTTLSLLVVGECGLP